LLDANEKVVESIQLYDRVSLVEAPAGKSLMYSCPNPLPMTLIPTENTCLKTPSRLKPSTSDFGIRPSLRTERVRFNNSKMPRNESQPGNNDNRSRGRHLLPEPAETHTRIYRI
jgi:hypothetical protein